MFRNTFAFGGTLLVAGGLVFLTPGPAPAFPPPGGFRAPVAAPRPPAMRFAAHPPRPAGGVPFRGHRPGFVGGYHHHYPYGGGHPGGHHYPYGGHHHHAYGWGAYYPYSGGYGGDYSYSYNPYLYQSYSPYDSSYPSSGSQTYPGAGGYDPSGPSSSPAQPESPAHVTALVPASATVWFDSSPTTATGPVRQYVTPPLTPGQRYTYWVRAVWTEHGREINQLQPVEVTAGAQVTVRFPAPPGTGR
jgi:uncharacterized protein (TIGR03000 family)